MEDNYTTHTYTEFLRNSLNLKKKNQMQRIQDPKGLLKQ